MFSLEQKLVIREGEGERRQFDGRVVEWLQTPQRTGGRYSSVCVCVYEPGKRAKPAHSHPNGEETIYIVSGNGKVKIGREISDIGPGSVCLFPQGVPHMVWNTGGEPLKLCCFYGPDASAVEYAWHEEFDFPEFLEGGRNG